METLAGLLILGGLGLVLWGAIAFIVAIGKALGTSAAKSEATKQSQTSDDIDGMNNGDYYNGPHGYSPVTGYPETQYGSGFDPDAEWNHEEQ